MDSSLRIGGADLSTTVTVLRTLVEHEIPC
jgi:hypothetical protein